MGVTPWSADRPSTRRWPPPPNDVQAPAAYADGDRDRRRAPAARRRRCVRRILDRCWLRRSSRSDSVRSWARWRLRSIASRSKSSLPLTCRSSPASEKCSIVPGCARPRGRYRNPPSVDSSRRPARARPSVTSSAYSRSPPTGSPLARRVTRTLPRSRSAMYAAVASPVIVGFVASTTSATLAAPRSTRASSSAMRRCSGSTPSIGESAPPSTWYRPAVLGRPLERRRCRTAPRRRRSRLRSRRASRQIRQRSPSARLKHSTQNPILSLTSLIASASASASSRGHAQQVEREPLRRALADARQARELVDQVARPRATAPQAGQPEAAARPPARPPIRYCAAPGPARSAP